jgi:hypothetical protein
MKIIKKDYWGVWIFKRYSFILEDCEESLTELVVSKNTWNKWNVGDFFDKHYQQFYRY